MAKRKISTKLWRTDWFFGLVVVLIVMLINGKTGFANNLDLKFFDFASMVGSPKPSEKVAVIGIDRQSIENLGRWPWSREVHASLIDKIAAGKPKVIVYTPFFVEPQLERGLVPLQKIRESLSGVAGTNPAVDEALKIASTSEAELNIDGRLAASIKNAGNVILPVVTEPGSLQGRPDKPLSPVFAKHLLKAPGGVANEVRRVEPVIPQLAQAVAGIGHLQQSTDSDGALRQELLAVDYGGQVIPSLALSAVAMALNVSPQEVVMGENSVGIGKLMVKTDGAWAFLPQYYTLENQLKSAVFDSAFDVVSGKVPPGKYEGRIVVVGASASGIGALFTTPATPYDDAPASAVAILSQTISSLLTGSQYTAPVWANVTSALAFFAVGAYLILVLPRLRVGLAGTLSLGLFLTLLMGGFFAIVYGHIRVQLVSASVLLILGYIALVTKRALFSEAGQTKAEGESADTNRMMGLALQGQGRLDEAFDRFRRVPLNEEHGPALMDNMYNLALDFERKRQFNKAQAVYEFMSSYDKDYKDLPAKLNRAKNLSETVILGGGGSHPGGTMILGDGSVEKPKLGRYDVEKELGKGAMGVVYLGKDPKIGRVVAIKTMALGQEFEGSELDDARERFFREAETAGRLQHPNIVTIYDAGEEHDLAYIAMEFLKGKDLVDFTRDSALLPMPQVVSICARVAEALAYAHKQNVVHRDIKPANVMYELSSDTVKVTDFGIARITDSSKTKTGIVLGTPSFMSPEQIAGKKVDGRSDLYSLGVMLFQMLSGVLPFRGDSMAELMYKIANEEAPDIRIIRREIPDALAAVVARTLSKRAESRYQDGDHLAADLRTAMSGVATSSYGAIGGSATPSMASVSAAALGAADKTQVMPVAGAGLAADKTVVLQATSADPQQATVVMQPPGAAAGPAAPVGYEATVAYRAAPGVSDNRAPEVDPFEKTVVTPASKPSNPQA